MVIGPVELPGEVVLLLLLPLLVPLLVQAARTLTESTATALMASAFFEKQGRSGLTPGFSFLLVQGSSRPTSSGKRRHTLFERYTGRMCFLRDECREIYRFVAIADQARMSWCGGATDGQRLVRGRPDAASATIQRAGQRGAT